MYPRSVWNFSSVRSRPRNSDANEGRREAKRKLRVCELCAQHVVTRNPTVTVARPGGLGAAWSARGIIGLKGAGSSEMVCGFGGTTV